MSRRIAIGVALGGALAALGAPAAPARPDEPAPAPAPDPAPDPDDAPAVTDADIDAMRSACEAARPTCDPVVLLAPLERRAVDRALAARGLELDRAPHGKRIGRIHVVTLDVFGPEDGFLRWLDVFHVTSKESAVRRDLIVRAGEPWDQRVVDETVRRLRDPLSTTLAAAVPVRAADPGEVDVLVVTRDVWSLRMNSNYELQGGQLTYLALSLSENNLAGLRKLLALSFVMDQGAYSIGPLYIDRNVLGRRLDLRGRVGPVFNRETSDHEGSEGTVQLSRPLWSLQERWGAGIEWRHRFAINRAFRGTGLRTYDAPETPEDDMLPHVYRQRRYAVAASVVRSFGDAIKQRVRGGYELMVQRPTLLPTFPDDPVLQDAFVRDVLPRSERTSVVSVGWELFEPRFRNVQNLATFELAEDTRMGVSLEASAGLALGVLGSESDFVRLSGAAGYVGRLGRDGLWKVRLAATTRLEAGEAIDNVVDARFTVASPSLGIGRVVTELKLAGLFRDRQNVYYTLGGDSGLRAYEIAEFEGDRRALWQVELRTRPIEILFTRWGAVAFSDLGGAAATAGELALHHDAGIGLRGLIPQLNPEVFRFDAAFALDADRLGHFRFTAGFDQSF